MFVCLFCIHRCPSARFLRHSSKVCWHPAYISYPAPGRTILFHVSRVCSGSPGHKQRIVFCPYHYIKQRGGCPCHPRPGAGNWDSFPFLLNEHPVSATLSCLQNFHLTPPGNDPV